MHNKYQKQNTKVSSLSEESSCCIQDNNIIYIYIIGRVYRLSMSYDMITNLH